MHLSTYIIIYQISSSFLSLSNLAFNVKSFFFVCCNPYLHFHSQRTFDLIFFSKLTFRNTLHMTLNFAQCRLTREDAFCCSCHLLYREGVKIFRLNFYGTLGFWAIRGQLYETNTEIMVYIQYTSIPCTPARYHPHALPAPTLSPPALFSSIRGIQSHTMTKVIVIIYI